MDLEKISFRRKMSLTNKNKIKDYIKNFPQDMIIGAGEEAKLYLTEIIDGKTNEIKGVCIYPSKEMKLSFIEVKCPPWAIKTKIQRLSGSDGPARVHFKNEEGVDYIINFDKLSQY